MLPTNTNPGQTNTSHSRLPDFLQTDLSVSANNFSMYHEYWIARSIYSFGKSGEQLRLNSFIPLTFPKPLRNALRINSETRVPIPGEYTYKREPMNEEELATFARIDESARRSFIDNRPLTDAAQAKLDRDEAAHTQDLDARNLQDNECHLLLATGISTDSLASIKLHHSYTAYLECERPYHRSLMYYRILADIHKYGDASTKQLRTKALFHFAQEGAFPPFLNEFNSNSSNFVRISSPQTTLDTSTSAS
jgi:hypothetical protein